MNLLMHSRSSIRSRDVKNIALLMISATAIIGIALGASKTPPTISYQGVVSRVVDGDSLYLRGEKTQIRLFGVDAPEVDDQGYQGSKDFLRNLTFGKSLICREVTRDKYARIVARCFLGDGREVNALMLDAPYTQEYCRFSKNAYGRCR